MKRWIALRYWNARERRARQHLDALLRLSRELPDHIEAEEAEVRLCVASRVTEELSLPKLHYPARSAQP